MKVRVGVGLGSGSLAGGSVEAIASAVVANGLDSLWLSEVMTGRTFDPLVALSWCAARHPELKVGTTMLLPGRNPLRLAKSLASLDRLSGGRLLVTLVPGLTTQPERDAIGVPPAERGAAIDDILPVLRRLWSGEAVSWSRGDILIDEVRLGPTPAQNPLEVWLGGMAPASLRRCGRLGDGWLPSLCTPQTAAAGREVVDAAAAEAGRQISGEHFGVSIGYASKPLSERAAASIRSRAKGADVDDLVPVGWERTRRLVEDFIVAGFSKFVLRPLDDLEDGPAEIAAIAAAVGDLQS